MIGIKLHNRIEYRRLLSTVSPNKVYLPVIEGRSRQAEVSGALFYGGNGACFRMRIGCLTARSQAARHWKLPGLRNIVIGMGQQTFAELSDAALIEVCQQRGAKDDRPFQELFRRYQSVVWRVCYSYMRNREDAEDLTQDVFFKVYRNLYQFEGRSSFKTWVYRVAINTCQNEIIAAAMSETAH